MHSAYNRRKIKALSDRGKRMAKARWDSERARIDAEMPARIRELAEIEIENYPRKQGDAIGCLQWTDFRTGRVRRWVVRIGNRIDRVTLHTGGKSTGSHGWTWVMDHLRGYLAGRK
jgi:hypothetical protein